MRRLVVFTRAAKGFMKQAVLIAAAILVAKASIIADQSTLNGNSFDITDYRLADDFTPSAAAYLNQGQFWYQAQQQTDLVSVEYAIYADNGGALGALLDSGAVSGPTTGYDNASGMFYAVFPVSDLLVSPGATYWLELHSGTSLIDTSGFTVSWAAADDNDTAVALENLALSQPDTAVGFSGFDQYSFVLSGTSVPEPSSAALLATGVLLTAALRFGGAQIRRRKL